MSDDNEKSRKRQLNTEDAALWRRMTEDVERFEGRDYEEGVQQDVAKEPAPVECVVPSDNAQKGRHKTGQGLDRRTAERLRKGQMQIDARLDLHGMNQGEARIALHRFIRDAYGHGKRCVLVITGKGKTGKTTGDWMESSAGVLKQKTPDWLREADIRDLVLETAPARRHGGDGALYVLLRRNRSY